MDHIFKVVALKFTLVVVTGNGLKKAYIILFLMVNILIFLSSGLGSWWLPVLERNSLQWL